MEKHKPRRIIGPWNLSDLGRIEGNGLKVFSCFHCGGGSTMGYKLAGFEVLGGVEIDPEMMAIYRANHKPKHSYLMGVQDFVKIPNEKLPAELFELDILDGSPPCSSFSMAGSREKKWGGEHHFREGQAAQHLDDLFFDFIAIAEKLKPKVVIAENVKGLIQGNAKGYVKQIFAGFRAAGYTTQLFLLNAAAMGVPQRRERTVFVAVRNDIKRRVSFAFEEEQIALERIYSGDLDSQVIMSEARFGDVLLDKRSVAPTLCTINRYFIKRNKQVNAATIMKMQSFPEDYVFLQTNVKYVCGMSVPPFMMQRIALEIGRQVFDKDYDEQIFNNFNQK